MWLQVVLQRAYKLVASSKDQTAFLAITLFTVRRSSATHSALPAPCTFPRWTHG